MDAESSQELTRIILPPPGAHAAATPTTALSFDTTHELLWAGNEFGRVTSFYGADLRRYCSYRAHGMQEEAVKQILPCDRGILSVGARSVHLVERRGLTRWHIAHPQFQDLRCICLAAHSNKEIIVAGCQSQMFRIDIEKGQVTEVVTSSDHLTILKRGGQYICAATSAGSVQLLDSKTLTALKTWKAHSGWISDMDANSNLLVTCGYSPKHSFGSQPDQLVKVFDLKTLMPMAPIQFHGGGASHVRLHPRMLTTGMIASHVGQLQTVDIAKGSMINVRHVSLVDAQLVSLEISPSGEAFAVADSSCFIQLWGTPHQLRFTNHSDPTCFADSSSLQDIRLTWERYDPYQELSPHNNPYNNDPYNTIGLPYYREPLLSLWPGHHIFDVGAPPSKIDPDILAKAGRSERIPIVPNSRKSRRNQAPTLHTKEDIQQLVEGPKFLSEQAKEGEEGSRRMSEVLEALNMNSIDSHSKIDIPAMYGNFKIQYSRFGVEDFDFGYYNKTNHSGLETDIHNSYANALLQLLRYTPLIRNLALFHTARSCLRASCLLCEMGFLFDMLEKADGQNCQATNFLKTLSALPTAVHLGLDEDSGSAKSLTSQIQAMNRFILDTIASDFRIAWKANPTVMETTVATVGLTNLRCTQCGNESMRPNKTLVHDLVYPLGQRAHILNSVPLFSHVLKSTVERQENTRGWCDRCKRYQYLTSQRRIHTIPPVLMLNAAVQNVEAKRIWSKPNWLPQEIGIIVDQGHFFCFEGQDLKHHLQRGAYQVEVYELVGFVADVNVGEHQKSHLISMINVALSSRDKTLDNQFHLFNDFLVRPTTAEEALRFVPSWKMPSLISYQQKRFRHCVNDDWKNDLDKSLIYGSDVERLRTKLGSVEPLSLPREAIKSGMHLGIDAEFVSLQQEEIEIKPDRSRSTLRPSRLALARVSVLRHQSPDQASTAAETTFDGHDEFNHYEDGLVALKFTPFVDDYIRISEPVVDYLTAYSGIFPGDLTPGTSPYEASGRLISLKLAYKKIWLLLNMGCIFVGHGLSKDFRTINIHIPKAQVIDTVDLFFNKRSQRKLSLRFLSWYLLGERVQVEGSGKGHDSIEDARMAMKLWFKWRELESRGKMQKTIDEIYKKGRETGFRVPSTLSPPQPGALLLSGRATPSSDFEGS